MLDQFENDEVLEAERPTKKSAPEPFLDAVPSPTGEQVLSAAITFDFAAESLVHQWMEADFADCLDRHQHFTETARTTPTANDWNTLFVGVQLSILGGDTEQQQLDKMDAWLKACTHPQSIPQAVALRSVIAFFSHQPKLAIDLYNESCGIDSNGGQSGVAGLPAMVFALSQVQQATQSLSTDHAGGFSSADFKQLQLLVASLNTFSRDYQKAFAGDAFIPVLRVLTDFVRVICGQREIGDTIWLGGQHIDASPWLDLFLGLARHWLGEKPDEKQVSRLAAHVERASEIGLHWFVDEGLTLLSAQGLNRDADEFQPQIRSTGWLLTVYKKQADWSGALDSLTLTVNRHSRASNQAKQQVNNRRISWWVDAAGSKLLVEPREQRQSKKGLWSRGKHFPLKLLLDECGTLDFLCDHDLKICAHLRNQLQLNHALHFERSFGFSSAESLDLIINHPRLYRGDIDEDEEPAVHLSIRARQSTLQVVEDKSLQEINISMDPYPSSDIKSASDFTCEWEDNNILAIHRYSEGQLDIARSLTFSGLSVPADASEPVLESLRSMAALVEIHSEINAVDSDTVVASKRLAFHIRPLEHGLDIEGRLYPLGESGPCVIPGVGKSSLYALVSGRPCNTIRDLDAEAAEAREVVNLLPLPNGGAGWQWALQDAEQALEVLAVLQNLEDKVTLLWPAGECISLSREIDSERLAIHFQSQRGGIGVAGDLKVEEGGSDTPLFAFGGATDLCPFEAKKIDLKKLLASLDQAQGRFLRLDDGKILQLSRRLRLQLEAINAVSEDGVAHELAVPMLEEASRGMVLRDDESWDEQLQKLREAEALAPLPPATLKAELRDYQLYGFQWMARLAHWGAGACLADDMGLGKTMQSLSLILSRSAGGPTLVAAPTSVCGNWLAEAEKFAPSLRLRWLGDKNRGRLLRDAGPNDLFVCSYGVLQNEIEMLQEIQWHTIIADEAQSFKNPGTRRSQAMMSLRGDFRVIATGTPIENHLGELWNLFRFINPGLLGSGQKFKERYSVPIEQHEDDMARHRLKTLIRPFILRRLKREVLTELPERTEITHMIEFNEAESNFYEGLRKQALQRISELSGLDSEQRFRVLAEITTLRQASCHPELVTDTPPCGSAKLRAFAEIVDELRHNGHRCLVFSQFVGHLSLIRKHLDANRISYQYLDGSTSVKKRKQAVDDFQAGEGELFLISLKAGGSGLNLTAADYVIHMDPWWNPAVEDQASDRAYRMGQKRPVTIYRMVVKDTIEEKIVKLHAQKRDLANALLEGTDGGSRLSVEQLVELIDDEGVDEGDG